MLEVKKEIAPWVDLQIVAFPQEGILSYPNGEKLLDQAMEMGADVVGGIPVSYTHLDVYKRQDLFKLAFSRFAFFTTTCD